MTRNKIPLDRDDILSLLEDLGNELAKRFDEPIEILVIGGACLILTEGNRTTTTDVDVLPLNTNAWSSVLEYRPGPVEKAVVEAIKIVGKRKKLASDWLNDDTSFLHGGIDGHVRIRVSECQLWAGFGMLRVFFPPRSYMLACKVFAGRDKDLEDAIHLIKQLKIKDKAAIQAVVDLHVPIQYQREYRTSLTIEQLEKEMKKRF